MISFIVTAAIISLENTGATTSFVGVLRGTVSIAGTPQQILVLPTTRSVLTSHINRSFDDHQIPIPSCARVKDIRLNSRSGLK
jgi:hypothetical protein